MKENKDSFNSFKLKNNSLLAKFLNDEKYTIILTTCLPLVFQELHKGSLNNNGRRSSLVIIFISFIIKNRRRG